MFKSIKYIHSSGWYHYYEVVDDDFVSTECVKNEKTEYIPTFYDGFAIVSILYAKLQLPVALNIIKFISYYYDSRYFVKYNMIEILNRFSHYYPKLSIAEYKDCLINWELRQKWAGKLKRE